MLDTVNVTQKLYSLLFWKFYSGCRMNAPSYQENDGISGKPFYPLANAKIV